MRDIKFRFRLSKEGEKDWVIYLSLDDMFHLTTLFDLIYHDGYKVVAKDEFTGLKDKNGKEIYEGDIISLPKINCPAEIVWNDKDACFACNWLSEETRRIIKEKGMPYLPGNLTSSGNPWEVIGNIYSNPELLEAQK